MAPQISLPRAVIPLPLPDVATGFLCRRGTADHQARFVVIRHQRQSRPVAMDLSDIDKFRDPIWRISSLYSIRRHNGKVIPFRPRPQQQQVIERVSTQGLMRIVILKARQLGFSTLLGVIYTDQLLLDYRQADLAHRQDARGCPPEAEKHCRTGIRLPHERTPAKSKASSGLLFL
jgi:hypothetical protein